MNELLPGLSHAPNIHPLVVHFPIALWVAALLFLGLGSLRRRDDLFRVGCWLVYLGLAGAAVSVGTGLWAAEKLGHDSPGHELVHVHRNWMFVASGLGALTGATAFLLRKRMSGVYRWSITAAMAVTVAVMALGADRGAELVFRYAVGVERDDVHPGEEHHDHGEHGGATAPSAPPAAPEEQTPAPGASSPTPSTEPRHDHEHGEHSH